MKPNRIIVSEEEWSKLSLSLQWELIALSKMTGEDIKNNLNDNEVKEYIKAIFEDSL